MPAAAPVASDHGCAGSLAPGNHLLRVTSSGLARVATLHVPPAARSEHALALVVALPGAGSTGRDMARATNFSPLADQQDFAVLYPTAWGTRPFWNMNGHVAGKPDDVAFLAALLDEVGGRLCVDRKRVFATGVSNGGGMAARLGCELANRFAAIAPVAGGYGSLPACKPSQPLSVLEIHGTGDVVVPYYGKSDGTGSVPRWLAMWRGIDGCTQPPASSARGGVARLAWTGCRRGTAIEHLRLAGEPHGWPSTADGSRVSATREVWDFFSRRARR